MNLNETNILGYQQQGSEIVFTTSEDGRIHLTFVSQKTARLYVDFADEGAPEPSYAIEGDIPTLGDIQIAEDEVSITVSTGEMAVRLTKQNIRVDYLRGSKLLTSSIAIGREDSGAIFCRHIMGEHEHFYGLGEDNDGYLGSMDRRGITRDMVTGQRIHIGHVTADIPVTFFMSTGEGAPYGMFVDNSYRMRFDMGKTDASAYSWRAEGGSFVQYIFAGDSFADILDEYTALTGRPSMPPLWALGYTQCRCSYWCWDEIDEVIETLREKRFPLDCVVFDFDWAECFHNFKWNKRWNGDSPRKIAEYRQQGLHFMVSNSGPMIRKDSDNFQSALDAGILAHDAGGNTVTCGHYGGELMDFSHPGMKEWIQPSLNRLMDEGVEAWWLDLTEPEGDPDGTQYYAGDKAKVHNPFCLMNVRLYNEISLEHSPDKRPFILTRTGTAGIQKYNASIWSGDVFSDYKTFAAHIPEALNTTLSGIPLWTSDSGGFMSSTNNSLYNENIYKNDPASHGALYERWLQFACFCPITRVHHAGQSSPFVFGEQLTANAAHYVRLRYRLLPYIYAYNHVAHRTGAPMMRALVFEYPQDEHVLNIRDEYLFGSELLVAPVTQERATQRDVYLPEGEWYDWDYGYRYEGGRSYTIHAPQNRIPVFVRAGAIIPMIPQVYNTKDVDWKDVTLKIFPKGESSFRMYTDDGVSYGFTRGDFTYTDITCEETAHQTRIRITRSNLLYAADRYLLQIHVGTVPEHVAYGGRALDQHGYKRLVEKAESGWYYDRLNPVLYVRIPADTEALEEVVVTGGAPVMKFAEHQAEKQISGQLPFLLPPASVPCRIACENYDRGGEGVAYHKHTDTPCELYRTDAVQIELCDDVGVGYCVRDFAAKEWLEYTINVTEPGDYVFSLRLAGDAAVSIDVNTQNRTGLMETSGERWHTYASAPVMLSEGEQVIRLFVHSGMIRANWIDIEKV